MQSLKKKFGKFAVSNEKMAMISGGINYCCQANTSVCRTSEATAKHVCGVLTDGKDTRIFAMSCPVHES